MNSSAAESSLLVSPQPSGRRVKPRAVRLLKLLLFLAVVLVIAWKVHKDLKDVRTVHFNIPFLVLTALCFVAGGFVSVAIRRLLLAGFCAPPPWSAMAAIAWIPQPAKYLPGKAGALLGTVWMLRRWGVREPVALTMLFMMTAMSLAVGITLSVPLMFSYRVREHVPFAAAWGLGALLLFLICLHPRVFGGLSNFLLRKLKRRPLEAFPACATTLNLFC